MQNSQAEVVENFLRTQDGADPVASWNRWVILNSESSLGFEASLQVWQSLFADRPSGENPCWVPDEATIAGSNIMDWCAELGLSGVAELHKWSVTHRSEFWEMAIEELGIAFRTEPDVVLASNDVTSPGWLQGAKLNIVESCFQAPPDQVAIISGRSDGELTYQTYDELQRRCNQVSNAMVESGFKPGDAVGIVLPVTAETISIYLGLIQAGLIPLSIAESFAAPEIRSRLQIGNAKSVLYCSELHRMGKTIRLQERVQEATDLSGWAIDQQQWRDLVNSQSTSFDPHVAGPNDAINILFSSGTTGEPKAIPWNHTTPIKCSTDGLLHHDLHPGEVVAWPTSLGWMMGPWLVFATLINRGTIAVYDDAPFGDAFGQFVQRAGVNMLGVVPSIVRVWKNDSTMEKFDWSSIRKFSSTGEASNATEMFYLSWLANFRPIIEYCGGTEIGGGYISSTVVQPNVPATFSTAAFGIDLEILHEDHSDEGFANVEPRDEGEMFLVPPSIGLSEELVNRDHYQTYYADCPQSPSGRVLRKHGDYFCRLANGYFRAGGRTDDTMNLGGIKVSSIEIETILNSVEGIIETAAVAIPADGLSGPDQLVVFAVLESNDQTTTAGTSEASLLPELNLLLKNRLNPLFKIRKLIPIDKLPRTASNKVMRRLLRDQMQNSGDLQ